MARPCSTSPCVWLTMERREIDAMRQPRLKNLRIETARGLAALLVVAGHVIGPDAVSGMQVADN